MEIWGRCAACRRWFHCPIGGEALGGWSCPGCGAEPRTIVNRAVPVRVAGQGARLAAAPAPAAG